MLKSQLLLPALVAANLKCSMCSCYLSVPPIMYDTKVKVHICGRCYKSDDNDKNYIENSVFETLGQLTVFPCSFSSFGCTKYMPWQVIFDHEKMCVYQPYNCPVMPKGKCHWRGPVQQMKDHFLKIHSDLALTEEFFDMPQEDNTICNKMLQYSEWSFLLQIQRNNSTDCWLSICNLNGSSNFIYDVIIASSNTEKDVRYCKNEVLNTTCWSDELKMINLNVTYLEEILKSKNVQFKFKINQSYAVDNAEVKVPVQVIDNQVLEELECPVCKEYMMYPIYNCTSGHSICNNCRQKLSRCPICSSYLNNSRNYTMERIIKHFQYICRNEGCFHTDGIENISKHEKSCYIGMSTLACPLTKYKICSWKGVVEEVLAHVEKAHPENTTMKLSETQSFDLVQISEQQINIVQVDNNMFVIEIRHNFNTISFIIHHFGQKQKPTFEFLINFKNQKNTGETLLLKGSCHKRPGEDEVGDSLIVMLDSVKSYINTENKLIFAIEIKKLDYFPFKNL